MLALSPARVRTLLRAVRGRRVLVLGDVMLDEFIWGTVRRISPEAPVPVVQVTRESFHVGGAGNVARNVQSLGGVAVLVAAVGADAAAGRLRQELTAAGVVAALVTSEDRRPTTVKTRIIAHHQQVVRADREQSDPLPRGMEDEIVAAVKAALPTCRVLVVSDYQKGVVTPRIMKQVLALARRQRTPVLVDPKVPNLPLYRGVTLLTPNQLEAEQAAGIAVRTMADLEIVGARLLRRLECGALLVTRGEHGMTLFVPGARAAHFPTAAREVFDVTGAGDTVIATFAASMAAGGQLAESARLANLAASVVVGKLGTATVSPEELLATVERRLR